MRKAFSCTIISIAFVFSYGCGVTLIQTPRIPSIPSIGIEAPGKATKPFLPPGHANVKYVEKYGKDSKSADNVTVRISSITDMIDDDKFATSIEGPDGKQYKYSIFPMMIVLDIANDTNHIITLRRTIIHLEDENQREYKLIDTFDENKRRLANEISKAFDDYANSATELNVNYSEYEKKYLDQYRSAIYGSYLADYERMVGEIKKTRTSFTTEGVRTADTAKGYKLTREGEEDLIKEYNPDNIYIKGAAEIKIQIQRGINALKTDSQRKKSLYDGLKNKAIRKIMSLPNVDNIITGGEYLPISILPGRSKKIIVPFSKRNQNEDIKSILVGVYDLPTKVNEAGDPIKRTNFIYHMIAQSVK